MTEQRVVTLPTTGSQGVTYVVEPGTTEWIWNGAWVQTASRAPFIPYSNAFKDVASFRDTEILTSQ